MTSPRTVRVRAEWDRCLGWLAIGAAVMAVTVGSAELSRSPYAAEQVAFLTSGGLMSLAFLCVGVSALFLADLCDEREKLLRLESLAGDEPTSGAGQGSSATSPVWAPGPVAGIVVLFAGWRQASTSVRLEDALEGLAPAAVGLGLTVAACGWRVRANWRAVAARRNRFIAAMAGRPAPGAPPLAPPAAASPDEWAVPGLRLAHRRECPALRFIEDVPYPAMGDMALVPCRICHRDL